VKKRNGHDIYHYDKFVFGKLGATKSAYFINTIEELNMNKILVGVLASIFLLGSSAAFASGNKQSAIPPMSAQDILNKMSCEGKKDGEKIRDRTDGEMVTCPAKIKNPRK